MLPIHSTSADDTLSAREARLGDRRADTRVTRVACLAPAARAGPNQSLTQAIEGVVREDFPTLIEAMRRFAAGDLSARVSSNRLPLAVRGKDETALLARGYKNLGDGIKAFGSELSTTGEALGAIIGDVKTTVDAAVRTSEGSSTSNAL